MLQLLPGDLVFYRGRSLLAVAIQAAERGPHEAPSWANHVGGIVVGGPPESAQVVEALWRTVQRSFLLSIQDAEVEVWRLQGLTDLDRSRLAEFAAANVGARYGGWKLLFHLADAALGWVARRQVRLFRRALFLDGRPICSWVAARAYYLALGYEFGVRYQEADPDGMLDFIQRPGSTWELVWEAKMGDLSKHFSKFEFACPCCDKSDVDPRLIEALERLRSLAGDVPINLSSGRRCPKRNAAVGGAVNSRHLAGLAADVRVAGLTPAQVADLARRISAFARGGEIKVEPSWTHLAVARKEAA